MPLWLISIIIGVVIGFIVVSAMRSQLKSVQKQSGARNYMVEQSLRLRLSTDRFLYENTTRTPRSKPNKK